MLISRRLKNNLKAVREKARTFFQKEGGTRPEKKKDLILQYKRRRKLSLKDCKEQLTEWARELVDREIRRLPERLEAKQLEDLKQKAIDTVMESGTPEDLIRLTSTLQPKKLVLRGLWILPK